ncbi:MAG TPA: hypothetical protein VGK41_02715, partial [Solirubrobacterales bacterium]
MASSEKRVERKPAGDWEARAAAALPIAGAGLVGLSLVLPHPSGGNETALILIATGMALIGSLCSFFFRRIPAIGVHALIAGSVGLAGLLMYESGAAVGQYGTIFVWATLISAYFFPLRIAALHFTWLQAVNAATLLSVESTAGYSPLTRWLFTFISLGVVMLLISRIVSAQARADKRARRFFELSHDMLCTMDEEGHCREVNGAWARHL